MSDVITTILRQIHTEGRNKSGEKEPNQSSNFMFQTPNQQGERPEISPHFPLPRVK